MTTVRALASRVRVGGNGSVAVANEVVQTKDGRV